MDYTTFFEHDVGVERLKWKGSQGIGLCPLPSHNDRNPSFSCCCETSRWKCFGCGESGNAYTLAKILCFNNPQQYLSDYSPVVKNGHNKAINPPEMDVDKVSAIKEKQARYTSQLPDDIKDKLDSGEHLGMDDSGRITFHYPNGIKHHKGKNGEAPYWEGDGSCQIFMEDRLKDYPTDKRLYVFEGEKDAIISPLKGISFSAGAGSIPEDISAIYDFKTIYIAYDNDKAGNDGAERLVERIKKESPSTIVKIIQWDKSLPKGYDIYDDGKQTGFAKFDDAVVNATEYTIPIPKQLKGFKVMDANELINTYKEPPKHIVEHMMVEGGVSLISGTDGVGKTWFGLQMGICIASGKEFLGFAVKKKPVLIIQFELSPEQLSDRLKKYDLNGTEGFLDFVVLKDDDLIFTDAWKKIEQTIDARGLVDGVVLIDNLYTSTNADVSKNQDLKPLLIIVDRLKRTTGNAFALFGHHNKHEGDREPILTKNIITGGKTLTNYVSNVFQLGNSSMGADVRRGKITKTRDSYTDLEHLPIRLEWNPEECLFSRQGIISNELLHTIQMEKQWEIKVLCELADYMNNEDEFDRQRLMPFIESMFPLETPDTNYKKGTRWLKKMESYGLISGGNNRYKLNRDEIRYLESENEKSK